jgi:hypothetical protein
MSKHETREDWIANTKGKKWGATAVLYDARIVSGEIGVHIHRTLERTCAEYAITPENDDAFWLDAFNTEKEAIQFCNDMGWFIVEREDV